MNSTSISLYRFMPYVAANVKAACSGQIWMSKPSGFNDPWDCNFPILTERHIDGDGFEASCLNNYDIAFESQLRKLFEPPKTPFKRLPNDSSSSAYPWAKAVESRLGEIATTCFCSDFKNHLLWSYYAQHHTGVCIKYDYKFIRDENPYPEFLIQPVRYSSHFPDIEFSEIILSHTPQRRLADLLFTKHSLWAHEREWRLVALGLTGGSNYDLPSGLSISHIYAGARMPENAFEELTSICAEYKVPNTKLRKSRHSYLLAESESELPVGVWDPKRGHRI